MSQMSGVGGDGFAVDPKKSAATGRAVALLAVAVILGILLLQSLDNTTTESASTSTASSNESPSAATTETTLPITPQVRTPSEVRVLVANGTEVSGAASRVAGRLQPIGYNLLVPGNTQSPTNTSTVQYVQGYQAEAQALATSLGIPASAVQPLATPAPVQDLQNANVVVVMGPDLAGQGATQNNTQTNAQTQQPVNPLNGPLGNNSTPSSTAVVNQSVQSQTAR